jgi:hypothetical protein
VTAGGQAPREVRSGSPSDTHDQPSASRPETPGPRDDVTLPSACVICGRELDVSSAPWRSYCSGRCRTRAWRRRQRSPRGLTFGDLLPEHRARILAFEADFKAAPYAHTIGEIEPSGIEDVDPAARQLLQQLDGDDEEP